MSTKQTTTKPANYVPLEDDPNSEMTNASVLPAIVPSAASSTLPTISSNGPNSTKSPNQQPTDSSSSAIIPITPDPSSTPQITIGYTIDESIYDMYNDNPYDDPDDPSILFDLDNFSYFTESKSFLRHMFLISIQIAFEFFPGILATIMVGHYYDSKSLDDEYISAIGLATTYIYVAGDAVVWGMTTALYTLIPQATGFADPNIPILDQPLVKNALAIHLQRSVIITIVLSLPIIILQFISGKLMTLLGEPEYLESSITNYTISMSPWIVASSIFTAIQRVCQALDFNIFLSFVTLFNAIISFPLMYMFMYSFGWGYIGTGIAQSVSFWLSIIVLIIHLCRKGYGFLFDFRLFSWNILLNKNDLISYIKLSLPGMIQNCLEWWVIEIAMIMSGFIGRNNGQETISISTAVICYNLYMIIYAFALGTGNAVNIRVGQYIGGNRVELAKKAAKLGVVIIAIFTGLVVVVLLATREDITIIFTHNPETRKNVSYTLFAFVFYAVFLLLSQFFSGLYRGLGRQDKTATFVLVSDYVVAIPVLVIVLFAANWREDLIVGSCSIWGALGLGTCIAVIWCIIYMIRNINWNRAAKKSLIEMENIRKVSQSVTPKDKDLEQNLLGGQ